MIMKSVEDWMEVVIGWIWCDLGIGGGDGDFLARIDGVGHEVKGLEFDYDAAEGEGNYSVNDNNNKYL
ncbi:hypothetical protein LguiB_026577 [Lonicera macranthoides]